MAEYPTTNINSELISAGLNPNAPAATYTDFATQLAKNQQEQAIQEQAIARAKEMTAQAQLQSRQGAAAEEAGANPLLQNLMTPEQAVAYLRIVLKSKGLPIDDAMIESWMKTLPEQIDRQEVEAFANRFARETTRAGQPAQFSTDQNIPVPAGKSASDLGLVYFPSEKKDDTEPSDGSNSAHVPDDGMYEVLYDNQGVIQKYIPGGKAPVDTSLKVSEKDSQFWTNQWKTRIANKINPYLASARTQVGVALQSYVRCVRALATLNSPPVSKQDALNVIMEIGSVYKGGSPDQSAILETSYHTIYGDFNEWLQSMMGKVRDVLPENVRTHLVQRIQDLEDQSKKVINDSLASAESLNSDVIEHFPDQWQKFLAEIDKELADANNPQPASPKAAPKTKKGAAVPSTSNDPLGIR